MNESGGPLVQIDVEAKEVAGTATLVRTDRPEGTIKGTAKIDRLDGTFVGADIRTTGDEK